MALRTCSRLVEIERDPLSRLKVPRLHMLIMSKDCSAAQELYLSHKFCALLSAVRCFALGAKAG